MTLEARQGLERPAIADQAPSLERLGRLGNVEATSSTWRRSEVRRGEMPSLVPLVRRPRAAWVVRQAALCTCALARTSRNAVGRTASGLRIGEREVRRQTPPGAAVALAKAPLTWSAKVLLTRWRPAGLRGGRKEI